MFADVFALWHFDPAVIVLLGLIAALYLRGWWRIRRRIRYHDDAAHLSAFMAGLLLLFIAGESPLDALDDTYVSAHMTQHLLLIMLAPALLLLGHPLVPLLRGLPRPLMRAILRPVRTFPELRRLFDVLTSPPYALALFVVSTLGWHVPALYELALRSPVWHAAEHACFFWTGILFWWPVIRPGSSRSRWPEWVGIPYLVLADLSNTILSAFFIFSGKLLYPSYTVVPGASRTPLEDQMLAGAIMWVPGSIVYLIPAVVLTVRLLSPQRSAPRPVIIRPAASVR